MNSDLPTLARDLDRIQDVPASDLPRLIGEAEALKAALWHRLQASAVPAPPQVSRNGSETQDELLTASEAAPLLGVSKRWMYRKADELPFTRRLSGGTLRFSRKGLERWKETRR
jgi:excisionase family DNA binding protein